jgi:hypothetical protein
MVKLGEQIEQANDKKDNKTVDELSKKLGELGPKLGPEYAVLTQGQPPFSRWLHPISKRRQNLVLIPLLQNTSCRFS